MTISRKLPRINLWWSNTTTTMSFLRDPPWRTPNHRPVGWFSPKTNLSTPLLRHFVASTPSLIRLPTRPESLTIWQLWQYTWNAPGIHWPRLQPQHPSWRRLKQRFPNLWTIKPKLLWILRCPFLSLKMISTFLRIRLDPSINQWMELAVLRKVEFFTLLIPVSADLTRSTTPLQMRRVHFPIRPPVLWKFCVVVLYCQRPPQRVKVRPWLMDPVRFRKLMTIMWRPTVTPQWSWKCLITMLYPRAQQVASVVPVMEQWRWKMTTSYTNQIQVSAGLTFSATLYRTKRD